jgi:YVTN family beta-propeller protein
MGSLWKLTLIVAAGLLVIPIVVGESFIPAIGGSAAPQPSGQPIGSAASAAGATRNANTVEPGASNGTVQRADYWDPFAAPTAPEYAGVGPTPHVSSRIGPNPSLGGAPGLLRDRVSPFLEEPACVRSEPKQSPMSSAGWPSPAVGEEGVACPDSAQPRGDPSSLYPYANSTLVLSNNSVLGGDSYGISEYAMGPILWDQDNGELYVADCDTNDLVVYNGTSELQIGRVFIGGGAGACPQAIAYDPENREIYVAACTNAIAIVNSSSNRYVENVTIESVACSIAFDPETGNIYAGGWVNSNLSVLNGTSNQFTGTIGVGVTGDVVYDPATGDLACTEGGVVAFVDPGSGKLVGKATAGNGAYNIVYDPADGNLYTSNFGDGTVSVINGTTEVVVGSFTVGVYPEGLTVDTRRNILYVANDGNPYGVYNQYGFYYEDSSVSIVNLTTDRTIRTVAVALSADGAEYDPASDDVFIAAGTQIPIFSASSQNQSRTLVIGASPDATLYDPANGMLYVTDLSNYCVWVIDVATVSVVTHVQVGAWPDALALDSVDGELFVTNQQSWSISVINVTTNEVVAVWAAGYYPDGVAVDPGNGRLFESDSATFDSDIGVFNVTTGNSLDVINLNQTPSGILYDPLNGCFYVGVTPWVEVYNASTDALVQLIWIREGSGTFGFALDPSTGNIYVSGADGTVSVIDGSNNSVVALVDAASESGGIAYDPVWGDVLVAGNANNVYVINATSQQLIGSIRTGWSADVAVDPATGLAYDSSSGTVLELSRTQFTVAVNTTDRVTEVGAAPLVFDASVASAAAPARASWSFGDGTTSENLSTAHAYSAPGVYLANLTVIDPLGVPLNYSENITVLPALTLAETVTPGSIDQGQSLSLTVLVGKGAPPYVTSWTFGDGSEGGSSTTLNSSWTVPHIYATPGVYRVTVMAYDQFVNRSFSTLVTVEPSPTVRFMMGPTTTTVGASLVVQANVTGGIPPYSLQWEFGVVKVLTTWPLSSAPSNSLSATHQFNVPGSYPVELSITDSVGESTRSRLLVDVLPAHSSPPRPSPYYPAPGQSQPPSATISIAAVVALAAALVVALGGLIAWSRYRARPPSSMGSLLERTSSPRSLPTQPR